MAKISPITGMSPSCTCIDGTILICTHNPNLFCSEIRRLASIVQSISDVVVVCMPISFTNDLDPTQERQDVGLDPDLKWLPL